MSEVFDKIEQLEAKTIPVSQGGTGATTAEEALANLSAAKASDLTTHIANKSNPHGTTAAQIGAFSTSSIIPISNGGTGANNATTALSNLGAQKSLGYTPVQQGGGINQTNNKIYLGWTGTTLDVTVDSTNMGSVLLSDSARTTILPTYRGGTGATTSSGALSNLKAMGVFDRSAIGTSPNFDNPGVNGLFEIRSSSETTGETGIKPFNSFGPCLSLKTPDNIAMLQLAGNSGGNFYVRANQKGNVNMSNIAWNQLVTTNNLKSLINSMIESGEINVGGYASGMKTFTSSGTFVVPDGVGVIYVTACGGGGGGGYGKGTWDTFGGGGGAGAGVIRYPLTVTAGQSLTITIGAGGAGGGTSNAGGTGGTTSIGSLLTLLGGNGGGTGSYGASRGELSGAGGVSENHYGTTLKKMWPPKWSADGSSEVGYSGGGTTNMVSGGGASVFGAGGAGANGGGRAGGIGAGGGGGGWASGGAGGKGKVVIEW